MKDFLISAGFLAMTAGSAGMILLSGHQQSWMICAGIFCFGLLMFFGSAALRDY